MHPVWGICAIFYKPGSLLFYESKALVLQIPSGPPENIRTRYQTTTTTREGVLGRGEVVDSSCFMCVFFFLLSFLVGSRLQAIDLYWSDSYWTCFVKDRTKIVPRFSQVPVYGKVCCVLSLWGAAP